MLGFDQFEFCGLFCSRMRWARTPYWCRVHFKCIMSSMDFLILIIGMPIFGSLLRRSLKMYHFAIQRISNNVIPRALNNLHTQWFDTQKTRAYRKYECHAWTIDVSKCYHQNIIRIILALIGQNERKKTIQTTKVLHILFDNNK